MSTVQEIKAAITALPDADFRALSQAIDEMQAERFDRALETAAQSGKLDAWLEKVDADIDAGRVKPLDEVINAISVSTALHRDSAACGRV